MPDKYEDALIGHDEKEKLLQYSDVFKETSDETKAILKYIKAKLDAPEEISNEDAKRYMTYQRALSEANYNFDKERSLQ